MHPKHPRLRRIAGFTLLEMMITVAIIAIIGGLALPSFLGSIRKGRRVDASDVAAAILQAQERWRSNNANYTTSLANLKITSSTTANGYYVVGLAATAGKPLSTDYTVSFTPVVGKGQEKDTGCTALSVVVSGGQPTYAPAACWSR